MNPPARWRNRREPWETPAAAFPNISPRLPPAGGPGLERRARGRTMGGLVSFRSFTRRSPGAARCPPNPAARSAFRSPPRPGTRGSPPPPQTPPPRAAGPAGLRGEVALLRGEVRAVGDQLRALGTEVRRQGRTDWPALLTAGGLAVTVAVGLGALALDPLEAAAARGRADAADSRAAHRDPRRRRPGARRRGAPGGRRPAGRRRTPAGGAGESGGNTVSRSDFRGPRRDSRRLPLTAAARRPPFPPEPR